MVAAHIGNDKVNYILYLSVRITPFTWCKYIFKLNDIIHLFKLIYVYEWSQHILNVFFYILENCILNFVAYFARPKYFANFTFEPLNCGRQTFANDNETKGLDVLPIYSAYILMGVTIKKYFLTMLMIKKTAFFHCPMMKR